MKAAIGRVHDNAFLQVRSSIQRLFETHAWVDIESVFARIENRLITDDIAAIVVKLVNTPLSSYTFPLANGLLQPAPLAKHSAIVDSVRARPDEFLCYV